MKKLIAALIFVGVGFVGFVIISTSMIFHLQEDLRKSKEKNDGYSRTLAIFCGSYSEEINGVSTTVDDMVGYQATEKDGEFADAPASSIILYMSKDGRRFAWVIFPRGDHSPNELGLYRLDPVSGWIRHSKIIFTMG